MARGFASGLVHGALLGALTLAGLSVLMPPPRLPAPQPALSSGAQDPLPLPDIAPAQMPQSAVGAQTGAQPPAQMLDLPAGSGFARPTDQPPKVPDSPAAPPTRPVPGTLAARSTDESDPLRDDAAGLRPDPAAQSPAVPDEQMQVGAAGDGHDSLVGRPLPDVAPARQPLPARPVDPAADAMPEPAAAASDAQSDQLPAETGEMPDTADISAPNLSTPPDFGALRLQP